MTQEKLEKGIEIRNEIDELELKLYEIEQAVSIGEKVEFRLKTSCSFSPFVEKLSPITATEFYIHYRGSLLKEIARLKRQFARL